jgi:hypothetical protein
MERSPLPLKEREQLLEAFVSVCEWVPVFFLWRPNLPDEGDNHLIELGVAGMAESIVTQNVRDLGRAMEMGCAGDGGGEQLLNGRCIPNFNCTRSKALDSMDKRRSIAQLVCGKTTAAQGRAGIYPKPRSVHSIHATESIAPHCDSEQVIVWRRWRKA